MLQLAAAALALAVAPLALAQKEREVSIGLQAAITSMDPHYHNLSPNNGLLLHVFEPLVKRDPNQKLVPGLATSWRAIDDLTWEFKLRKNVRWHDGSPFTAEDVLFTLKRVPDVPNSPSSFATFTKPIVEARATDPHTLIFKTASPHVLLPSDMGSVYIVSRLHGEKATTADYNSGKAAIGTGPYKLVEYVPNQRVVLKANFGYWGGEEPWDKVTFKILTNSAARVAALLSNDVQMIETVPTSDIARLAQDKKYALSDKVSNRVIYVHLNQWDDKTVPFVTAKDGKPLAKNPFKDVRVRKALSTAINREAIADRIMEKKAMPAAQLLPDIFPGTSKKLKPPKYDPEAAKEAARRGGLPERLRHDHPRTEQPLHQRRGHLPGDRPVLFARGHRRQGRDHACERVLHARHQG
jgi:peptide/nickel transport system substrate-binding protein